LGVAPDKGRVPSSFVVVLLASLRKETPLSSIVDIRIRQSMCRMKQQKSKVVVVPLRCYYMQADAEERRLVRGSMCRLKLSARDLASALKTGRASVALCRSMVYWGHRGAPPSSAGRCVCRLTGVVSAKARRRAKLSSSVVFIIVGEQV